MNDIEIIKTDWQSHQQQLTDIRYQVFVVEQQVPVSLEIDDQDPKAIHWLVINKSINKAVATARMLQNGHIGRMAVLPAFRHKKIGSELLNTIINNARKQGLPCLFLNAQTDAQGFYEKMAFTAEGDIFIDAGIPHIRMSLDLKCS